MLIFAGFLLLLQKCGPEKSRKIGKRDFLSSLISFGIFPQNGHGRVSSLEVLMLAVDAQRE